MIRVWIAQMLCPQRHAIVAIAGEADSREAAAKIADQVRGAVDSMMTTGGLNPWCGLCHAPRATWSVDLQPTRFETMIDALNDLRETEARNIATGLALGELGGTKS